MIRISIVTAVLCACSAVTAIEKPNIVILLADDLGYRDVSFNGGDIRTPHIDRIAKEGVTLSRFYACSMCSPTRAGLLTGRWPIRMGMAKAVIPPWRNHGLPTSEQTLAGLVTDAGYLHRACIGKWHLGHLQRKWHPTNRGFTHFYGHYNGAIDYFSHQREGEVDWHRGGRTINEEGYTTDLLGAEAVRFIGSVPKDRPYLLYVPFNAPHSPFQAKSADIAKYPNMNGRRQTLAAMIDSMDQAIGVILEAIDRRGDAENTFVLFFSDNGGVKNVGDNAPLRGAKLTPYEGGIRVAACVRWPRGELAGGKTCNAHIGYIDVYPTVKRIIGLSDDNDPNTLDGRDVLDVIRGKAEPKSRDWFTWEAQGGNGENLALHSDGWKLVLRGPSVLTSAAASKAELFQITHDPNEKSDLAKDRPDLVKQLIDKARGFRKLRPHDGIVEYNNSRKTFRAPKDWLITR